jgi:ribosomal protection tetracycline resistance protein
VTAGEIALVSGLDDCRVGDPVGVPRPGAATDRFPPPTLETVVVPRDRREAGALHTALTQLAEQDPLINLRRDELRDEVSVSLYGEVQKEVIAATLAQDHGVEVGFRETTVVCVERVTGTGAAVELIDVDPNPFLATVGLRIGPAPVGAGVRFGLGVELGSMPAAFFAAVEQTVRQSLAEGLHGWTVPDCEVTVTHSGYWPRQSHAHATFDKSMSSTAGDFRLLTPLVLMDALRIAGTTVCEPVHRFRLETPPGTVGMLLPALGRLRAVPLAQAARGPSYGVEGEVPAAQVHALSQQLPSLTNGEGTLETEFARHRPVIGPPPSRPRTDHNPLDRKAYLLATTRRVSTGSARS